MKKNKWIGLLLLLTVIMLGGCSTEAGLEQSGDSNLPLSDTVILAMEADIATLDPHYSATIYDSNVYMNIYDTLVFVNLKNEFVPSLAKDWTISEDRMVYTMYLEEDVLFHNGETMTAADVVFSLNRAKGSPYLASNTAQIDHVEALDESTVEITLTAPHAPFMLSLAGIHILNEQAVTESGDSYSEQPVGTGPYQYVGHEVGQSVTLKRFDEHFKGVAPIENAIYKIITDPNTAVIALESGEIDFSYKIPMISRQDILANPDLRTYELPSRNLNYLLMNNEVAPFDEMKVRQAINYAIDKETIIAIVEEGLGEAATCVLNDLTFGFTDKVSGYEYNPEKARKLLEEAGYPNGFDVVLKTMDGKPRSMMQVVQENLKEIGIRAEIEVNEGNAYIQDAMSGNYEIGYMAITLAQDADFYSMCLHPAFPKFITREV